MGGFHGGFLIWDELEEVYGRKMSENGEICHFLGKTRKWYRYQRVVPVPIGSEGLVSVLVKVVPVPLLSATIFLHAMHS